MSTDPMRLLRNPFQQPRLNLGICCVLARFSLQMWESFRICHLQPGLNLGIRRVLASFSMRIRVNYLQPGAALDLHAVGLQQGIQGAGGCKHQPAHLKQVKELENPAVHPLRGNLEPPGDEGDVKLDPIEAAQHGGIVQLLQELVNPTLHYRWVRVVQKIVRVGDAPGRIVDAGHSDPVLAGIQPLCFYVEAEHITDKDSVFQEQQVCLYRVAVSCTPEFIHETQAGSHLSDNIFHTAAHIPGHGISRPLVQRKP